MIQGAPLQACVAWSEPAPIMRSTVILLAVSTQIISHISDWSPSDIEGLPEFAPDAHDVIFPRHYASLRAREPSMRPVPYIPQP